METYEPIVVVCRPTDGGWSCRVNVGQPERALGYEVSVSRSELETLAPGSAEPTELVSESFRFLLEREPPESILRRFEITVIGRYFPEYPVEIAGRLAKA